MTEILTTYGNQNATCVLSFVMVLVSVCAFLTTLIVEMLKCIRPIDTIPTKLVAYIVSVVITTPVFCAMMAFMNQTIEWFMIFASFMASFVIAKVSMNGWDDVVELWSKLYRRR